MLCPTGQARSGKLLINLPAEGTSATGMLERERQMLWQQSVKNNLANGYEGKLSDDKWWTKYSDSLMYFKY